MRQVDQALWRLALNAERSLPLGGDEALDEEAVRVGPEYHRLRKHVYQLYELINHFNAFGPEYLKPLLGTVEKVGALM